MKYCLAALAVALALLSACELRKPVMPKWDIELNLPLLNERYYVSDLVDSVNIISGDNDILTFTGSGTAETDEFGNVAFTPNISLTGVALFSGGDVSSAFPFADPTGVRQLSYGRVVEGFIAARFQDIHPGVQSIKISLIDIRNPNGSCFEINYQNNSSWHNHSLVGCRFGIENSNVFLDEINFIITIVSTLPDQTPVGSMDIVMNNQLSFNFFQGTLQNYDILLNGGSTTFTFDYPLNIQDAIHLSEASLFAVVTNETGFSAELHGVLYAKNTHTGEETMLDLLDEVGAQYIINPATNAGPGISELDFAGDISSVLQIMPDSLHLTNAFIRINCGIGGTIGTVRNTDVIRLEYRVDAPLIIELFDTQISVQNPTMVEISEENRRRIRTNARTFDLSLLIKNNIPIGVEASVYIGTQEEIDINVPESYSFYKTVNVHSRQYVEEHPEAEDINSLGEQLVNISLTEEEVTVFTHPAVYLMWAFRFEPSNGLVTITTTLCDYIQIRSMSRIVVRVQGDE